MQARASYYFLHLLSLLLAACAPVAMATSTALTPSDTATSSPLPTETATSIPSDTATSEPTATVSLSTPVPWPTGEGACTLTATGPTTIYSRPSLAADVFFEAGAGFETGITARTATGWAGFDPAIAQAANMGSFRLRWIPFAPADFSGDCAGLPEVWGPLAGLCYTMPMELVTIYTDPDTNSNAIAALDVGDFAAVLGVAAGDWVQVYLTPGNTGLEGVGWMDSVGLNLNGPCQELLDFP